MRRAAVDANQKQIIDALRKAYATVQPLHTVGKGCPDLLVGFMGKNYLFEVKDGEKYKSKQKLTKDQEKWHSEWRGQVVVVTSVKDALEKLLFLGME